MESIFAFNVAQSHLIPATISINFAWEYFYRKENATFVRNKQIDYISAKNAIFMSVKIVFVVH